MTTKKMTITRALSELKLLDKRITKTCTETNHFDAINSTIKLIDNKTKEEFIKESEASLQSFDSLYTLRNNIKSAIVLSNATTNVTIGGKSFTVAEAIEMKTSIDHKKLLLAQLKNNRTRVVSKMETNNTQVMTGAVGAANQVAGSDGAKTKDQNWQSIHDSYVEAQKFTLVVSPKTENLIKSLELEIDDFESEVDYILSESNSTTFIEV